jgi:hypothetical protein
MGRAGDDSTLSSQRLMRRKRHLPCIDGQVAEQIKSQLKGECERMAANHRIFTSFAVEDANLRTMLVGQARHDKSPFSFVDMSVKDPWDEKWKSNCRSKIKGCDGVIGIITNNTVDADGQLWELNCAIEEGVPVMLMYGNDDRPSNLPEPVKGRRINIWTWPNVKAFLDKL